MNNDKTAEEYAELFGLTATHSLTLQPESSVTRDSTIYKTRWIEEHDSNSRMIARFRAWTNRQLKPPYKRQTGWERFSLTGALLDREVRYSERDDTEYLH